ncbi:hypothetical protein EBZU44_46690 [Enterobacter cloacae]|nr:hypothetical protein KAM622c_59340 [Klebsiella quasipneumoniae subsp. quasipneumoniae]BDO22712.1 hypothetical protein KAM645c_58020 [Klebsiella quasipneumoniae subsp. quasipneumoniae]GHM26125.1 hypothetical protein EBZU44_46690 [Enterobacter cloacae]
MRAALAYGKSERLARLSVRVMFSVSGALVTGSSNCGDDSVTAGCSVVRLRQR